MVKKVGITGGIGSGKSTVCKIFEQLGVPVFYADEESKKLLETKEIVKQITNLFGPSIINEKEEIDRSKLAAIVFENKNELEKLNSLLHPAVGKAFDEWLKQQTNAPYIIKEAAILFESGSNKLLDKTINVQAPTELKINRIIKRDNSSREKITARMQNQLSDEERNKLVDFIITNDEIKPLIPQVLKIHNELLKDA